MRTIYWDKDVHKIKDKLVNVKVTLSRLQVPNILIKESLVHDLDTILRTLINKGKVLNAPTKDRR